MRGMGGFITIGGIKGGTGKTSVAVTLAVALHRAGHPVAVLDADPQQSAARWLDRTGLGIPVVTVRASDDPRGSTIAAARAALEAAPYVVADGPPAALDVLAVLVTAADLVLIPTGPSAEEIHLGRRTVEIAHREAALRRVPVECLIVPTRIDPRTGIGRDALELLAALDVPVAGTMLRSRVAWLEAVADGVPIFDLPAARAADAIREAGALCEEIIRRLHEVTRP
jgi:chromosome partitioning protein